MASDKKEYLRSVSIMFVVFLLIAGFLFLILSNVNKPHSSPSASVYGEINYTPYFNIISHFDPSLGLNNLTRNFDISEDIYIPLNPLMSSSSEVYHWKIYSKGKYEGSYDYFNLSEKNLFLIYNNSLTALELYYFSHDSLFDNLNSNYKSFIKSYSCSGNLTIETLDFKESNFHVQGYEATYLPTGQITTQIIVSKDYYPNFIKELLTSLNCSERVR